MAAGAAAITSEFHEEGKAHLVTSIPETRIVLGNVVMSRDHFCCHPKVGPVGKEEETGNEVGS